MQMSWRAHLSCTGILHQGLNACCSAPTLNTEISWWGALWSRLKLMCECKICAWKTQLLNQIIMLNKDTYSKENLRETVVKISYFSQPPLTYCHIFEKSQAPALPGHFPWVRKYRIRLFVGWMAPVWQGIGDGLLQHELWLLDMLWQWRESKVTFQYSVAQAYWKKKNCWEKAVCCGNADV